MTFILSAQLSGSQDPSCGHLSSQQAVRTSKSAVMDMGPSRLIVPDNCSGLLQQAALECTLTENRG